MTDAAPAPGPDLAHRRTARLRLDAPRAEDLAELHELYADPRVWTHFPSGRSQSLDQTRSMLEQWMRAWDADGLGPWIVRDADGRFLGNSGCRVVDRTFWNLGYRFTLAAQGQGFATEAGREAITLAHRQDAELPIVAYMVEHNTASVRLAERLGLTLRHRGLDAHNPDPGVIRRVHADRALDADQLAAVMR